MSRRLSHVWTRVLSFGLIAALLVPLQPPGTAEAISSDTIFAVTVSNKLIRFNPSTPGTIAATIAISNLQAGESIQGIDFRPATGQLFGLGSSGRLYTINTATGAAIQVGSGTFAVPLSGADFGFDFNPTVDRIRVFSDTEQNLRLNPDTGAVVDFDPAVDGTQADPSLNPGGSVVAAAYTNNFPGAGATTLFGIDSGSDQLVRIGGENGTPSPNLGAVTAIGPLGVDTTGSVGFDIGANDNIAFASLTPFGASSSQLFRINLGTGTATLVGAIGGAEIIRGLAVAAASPTLFALTSGNNLVRFSSGTPGTIAAATPVSGLQPGESLLAIDFRPSSGELFALGDSGRLYVVNSASGAATQVGSGTFDVPLNGTSFGFDFNPTVDRIRVVSDSEQNLRLNPDTGAVVDFDTGAAGTQADPNLSPAGSVVALAYTNNVPSATSTTLFGIDSASDQLVRLGGEGGTPSPNLGAVTSVGPLGVDTSNVAAFDIASGPSLANTGFAALTTPGATSSQLFTIDLTTGTATLIGTIGATETIRGLTAAPILSVSASDAPDPTTVNGPLTYTATATNNGPVNAAQVRIVQKFPPSLDFVSASATSGTCIFESAAARGKPLPRVICNVGDLTPGASVTATIQLIPRSGGTIGSVSRVKLAPFTQFDPLLSTKALARTTTVTGPVTPPGGGDLVVTIDPIAPVRSGQQATITARINRASAACGLSVDFPSGDDAEFPGVDIDPATGTCTFTVTIPASGGIGTATASVLVLSAGRVTSQEATFQIAP